MTVSTEASREIVEMLRTQQAVVLDQEIADRRQTIDRQMKRNERLRVDLTLNLSVLRAQQDLLDVALKAHNDNNYPQQLLLQGWESLRSHPRLAGAMVRPSTADPENEQSLFLTTTADLRLHRSDTGESRWLGAFEIELTFATGEIKMRNLDTRRGGRDHPHIVDQHPCFGQHADTFAQLMSTGDLFVLYELLIQYIETLNLEDEWGRYGAYWFEVEDEQPESKTDAREDEGARVEAVAA
jgi:hypothetical protein